MSEILKGKVSIVISEDEMSAQIQYVKGKDVFEWEEPNILKLLEEAGVKKGFNPKIFPKIYEELKESIAKVPSTPIAEGVPAVLASPVAYSFVEFPPSAQNDLNLVNKNNPDPEVYKIDSKGEITGDKVVVKKNILKSGYFSGRQKVADITLETVSSDGYAVTGRIVKPEGESPKPFFQGKGFSYQDGVLSTLKSGVVRIGENWVDFIPFSSHFWKISLSEDNSECFITFKPGSAGAQIPSFLDFYNKVEELGFPEENLLDESEIMELVEDSVNKNLPLNMCSISRSRTSRIEIVINSSATKAVLELEKGTGPEHSLSLKKVGAVIRESGLKGMNLDALKKDILDFYRSKDLKFSYTLLEGKSPTRGLDRVLEFTVPYLEESVTERVKARVEESDILKAPYPSFGEFPVDTITQTVEVLKDMVFGSISKPVAGEEGTDIYGKKIPGLIGNDPLITSFENVQVSGDEFRAEIDGILDIGEKDGVTLLRVREHRDMKLDITVSNDNMEAYYTLHKEVGSGEPVSTEALESHIVAAGINKGIKEEVLEESVRKMQNGEIVSEVLFAEGRIPSDRKRSRIKMHKGITEKKKAVEVKEKEFLAKILPPTEKMEDGYDVYGNEMASSGVIQLDLDIQKNIIKQESDDGSVNLIAACSGEFHVDEKRLWIQDTKILKSDVNVKTGSLKSLCSLMIDGSIMDSFYVISGGNVKISGTVQGALISAEKNIIIAQGIKGADKAVLRAKESIDVKFVEKANLMSVGDTRIRKAALQSIIKCNGKLKFSEKGSRLIGGVTYVRNGLVVDELGSKSGSRTVVSFGQDYLIADKIKVAETEIEKIQKELVEIDNLLERIQNTKNRKKVVELRKRKVFLMKTIEKKNMKLFLYREKYEQHYTSEIVVKQTIYPGVIIESHGRTLEINVEEEGSKIFFDQETGHIIKKMI